MADKGYTFHALAINFWQGNPSVGLQTGHYSNAGYFIVGADADLGKAAGFQGTSLHYETTFFGIDENLKLASQIGDSLNGYQPPYTPVTAWLSVMTLEQKFFNDRLDFEIGKTHPDRYYALPNCDSINSCYQDILQFNGGWTGAQRGVWGANLKYHIDSVFYVQAGAFSGSPGPNSQTGYRWFNQENPQGVVAMAEVGAKTTFATDPYPYLYSFTGFYNSQSHIDYNPATAFGVVNTKAGTSGVLINGEQIVWRADGGMEKNLTPTAISLYGSAGFGLDSTTPLSATVFVGAKLLSPFAGRPHDVYSVKFYWERLNPSYNAYLAAANFVSGGSGAPFQANKYIIEANAHMELPAGLAFEPVVRYVFNPNSFFNPLTPTRPKNGVYVGGTVVVPLGVLLGMQAPG